MADCRKCKRIQQFMDDWMDVGILHSKILERIDLTKKAVSLRSVLDTLMCIENDIEEFRNVH